jgi:regulatory protein|tara:strand:+ start:291 stop:764 length:474 start_codon:yes stop_codon:yes gene_type:complete
MYSFRKSYTLEQALSRLQRYCTYQDRCHIEVERKLTEMRMIPQAKEQIIMSLIEDDYLNEERFALAFVKGKFRIKKWGRIRLKAELKKRKISKYLIKSALEQISEKDYLFTFEELANRKANSIKADSILLKKKKLADYLIYRGWESSLVNNKVNQLF